MNWAVVVAAGGFIDGPLAEALGTRRKALAVLHGRTCLEATLEAVKGTGLANCVTVCGPDATASVRVGRLLQEADSQIKNARLAVEALDRAEAVLFLPADSPLLKTTDLQDFMRSVEQRATQDLWLAAGVTETQAFQRIFPDMHLKPINLKDGSVMSGALYAASPPAFFHALDLLSQMSGSRKHQFAMLRRLGPWTLVRYLLRQVSVADAERVLSRAFDAQAIIVQGCDPLMAADIDDVYDFEAIKRYMEAQA